MPADGVIGKLPEHVDFTAVGRQLEMPEAQEGFRYPAYDGAGLLSGMSVVKHVAHRLRVRTDQRQGAGARNAQVEHGFAAQEFTDRGAQHRAAVGMARERRRTGTFQLQGVPADFTEIDGAAIAQLPGPMAELMPAVYRGIGPGFRADGIACQHREASRIGRTVRRHAKQGRGFMRPQQQCGIKHRRSLHKRVDSLMYLPCTGIRRRIGRQGLGEGIGKGGWHGIFRRLDAKWQCTLPVGR